MPRSDDVCKDFNIENKDQVKHFMFSGTEVIQVKASDNEGWLALAITQWGEMNGNTQILSSL